MAEQQLVEGLRKNHEGPQSGILYLDPDVKSRPLKYEAGVTTTRPRC